MSPGRVVLAPLDASPERQRGKTMPRAAAPRAQPHRTRDTHGRGQGHGHGQGRGQGRADHSRESTHGDHDSEAKAAASTAADPAAAAGGAAVAAADEYGVALGPGFAGLGVSYADVMEVFSVKPVAEGSAVAILALCVLVGVKPAMDSARAFLADEALAEAAIRGVNIGRLKAKQRGILESLARDPAFVGKAVATGLLPVVQLTKWVSSLFAPDGR